LRAFAGLTLLLMSGTSSFGYSVLSHEAVIDALWEVRLKAILLIRFPDATPEQLKEAHAYAYGGAILQDMGYYPNANGFFSDLTHYARSADFIQALISDARTLDDYAFALGALSHYASDNDGHRLATNIGEGLLYPKLRHKYGQVVTYSDDPSAHLRTEYAFDVEEVAEGNYASAAYHEFIGFNVPKALLEQAFRETYNFELAQMFDNIDLAIGSYRHTLSTLIPFFTRVAWADHKNEIQHARPGVTKRQFLYVLRRSSYEREWGKQYEKPSVLDRIVAFIVKLLPPIGRLKVLKFRPLTPQVEQLFMKSFDQAAKDYRHDLDQASVRTLHLENTNFDVGKATKPGEYSLQDETYAFWLERLAKNDFKGMTPEVAHDILEYFRDPNAAISRMTKKIDRQRVLTELEGLKRATVQDQNSSLSPN
jgi:hypothetical protein